MDDQLQVKVGSISRGAQVGLVLGEAGVVLAEGDENSNEQHDEGATKHPQRRWGRLAAALYERRMICGIHERVLLAVELRCIGRQWRRPQQRQ